MNIWRHLRLAGALSFAVAMWTHSAPVLALGFVFLAVGTVNGLYSLELRVEALEKERTDHEKTRSSEQS